MSASIAGKDSRIEQTRLACGVDLLLEPMPGYHTATLFLRIGGGMVSEPAEQLGLAYVLEQSIDKGTANFSGRELADAFDAIGAEQSIHTGRQSWVFAVSSLPEHLPRAIELLAETFCRPTFPDDATQTAISLSAQQLLSLEDSPRSLLRRQMALRAYGPVLGRHQLGRAETLEAITPQAVRDHWQRVCQRGAVSVAIAGCFDRETTSEALERGLAEVPEGPGTPFAVAPQFTPGLDHLPKRLEQTQIGISFPGVPYESPDYPVERVLLAVLSGGMSARLFTEVREKLGLVYWVGAWSDQPRKAGMVHIGAATTPQRCRQTYETLLREVARLEHDLTADELERAKVGLTSEAVTSGASVQRRAGDMIVDHFHLGRAQPLADKLDAIDRVTIEDIREYLQRHPREALSIATVGSEALELRA